MRKYLLIFAILLIPTLAFAQVSENTAITGLDADTTGASGDLVITADVSDSNRTKKMTTSDLFGIATDLEDGGALSADTVAGNEILASGVAANSYECPAITVDEDGRLTYAASGSLTGLTDVASATQGGAKFLRSDGTSFQSLDLLMDDADGADADSANTDSDSGLEWVGSELTLLRGCGDNEILKWDEGADDWNCEADGGAAGGDSWGDPVDANIVPDGVGTRDLGSATGEFDDLFLADASVINLGNDQDVTITHVADTGIQMELDDKIMFGDTAVFIHSNDDGYMDIDADTGIRLNGDVTGSTFNNITITAPAASGTLTIVDGKTLTATNTVNLNSFTDEYFCNYEADGTQINCDKVTDGSGDCASGAICLGGHTHSAYGDGDVTQVFDCAADDCNTMTVGTSEWLVYGTGFIDANRFAGVTTVDGTEFGYLNGVTNPIQTQFSGKQAADDELTTIAALTETEKGVMFATGGVWTTDTTPAIDCTDCTNMAAGGDVTDVYNCNTGDCATITMGATDTLVATDGSFIDFSAVNCGDAAEGILLPQAADCSAATAEGQICWDTDGDELCVGDGAACAALGGGGGATAWDDIGDAAAAGSIAFDAGETATLTGAWDGTYGFNFVSSDAAVAAETTVILISGNDDGEPNLTFIEIKDNAYADTIFKVGEDGDTTIGSGSSGAVDFGTNTIDDTMAGNLQKDWMLFRPESAKISGPSINKAASIEGGESSFSLVFDNVYERQGVWSFRVPYSFSTGDPVVKMQFTSEATSAAVDMEASIWCVTPGEAEAAGSTTDFDTTVDVTGGQDTSATAQAVVESSITMTSNDGMEAGDFCSLRINRDIDDGDDTSTADLHLKAVQLEWRRN